MSKGILMTDSLAVIHDYQRLNFSQSPEQEKIREKVNRVWIKARPQRLFKIQSHSFLSVSHS